MPVTPYTSSNTYTSRPYSRGNTGNLMTSTTTTSSYGGPKYYGDTSPSKYYGGDTSPSKYYGGDTSSSKYYGGDNSPSKYYGGDTLPSSITSTYKAGGYGKSKVPLPDDSLANKSPAYLAGRYKSSDYVTESQTLLELKLKKSNSNSTLFSGNTANILKNFGKADDKSRISPFLPPKPTYSEASRSEERKFCGKSGGLSVFANQYLAKVNRGKDYRPREIDTRDINTTVKPRVTPGFNLNINGKGAAITRASRNVVRLTIKREELDDPFVVKDKTIKTIAHRLFEKYTDKEKKYDPYEYVPRRRRYEEKRHPDNGETSVSEAAAAGAGAATSVSAVCTPSPSSIVTFSIASDATANSASKDPTISTTPLKKNSLADLRTTLSPQSSFDDEGGDVAYRLLRATSTAVKKKDLENAEEVKDAIIAVVLHPDVDIESDEEMKELVQGNKTEGSKWRAKKDIDKYTESSGDHSDEGKTIVGQLKRFVKKQVSTKGKKKSDEKEHRSSKKSKRESKKSENLIDELTSTHNTGKVDEIKTTASSSLSLSQKKKTSVKNDDSILSADLIFGANKLSKHKKSKDKVSKSADVESKESLPNSETSHSRKSDKKSGLSLLSADLVYNNFTSDEENDSRTKTLAPTEKEKVETIQESITGLITKEEKQGEKEKKEVAIIDHPNKSEIEEKTEKPVSKIPKLKKKVKKMSAAPATEKATEVLPEIKVSPVGSPSETPPKGPRETEEKLTDFKEARESDTLSLINKKISSKTSTTAKAFETSDHQLESTSYVGHKKSIPGKEIKSVRSEKSSPDDKKEKLSEEKSISDVSVELKTSRNSKVGEIALGNKDENAVKLKVSREDEIALMDNRSELVIAKDEVKEEREEDGKYGYLTNKDKELEEYKDNASSPSVSKIDSVKDTREDTTSILKKKISSKKSLSMSASKKKESKKAVIAIKENERVKEPESSTIDETFLSTEEKEVLKAAIEKNLGIMEGNTIQDRLDDKETKQEELPTDALTGKKAVKRPRQVGAPAPQENVLGNTDLMNMRKILKRPVKKIGVTPAPDEKQEQDPTTPEDPTKKLWKRPILVPPKEGDQFLQARNVLKKPVKSKAPLEDKGEKPTGKLPELMLKKGKKPGAAPAQKEESVKEQRQRSRSPSSSDEEEGEGRDKMGERQKRLLKPRPPTDKKAPSPPESPSGTAKLEGSGKDPKLSACQSADSGYGSSPSTPQPTQTAPDVKNEEICTVCGTNCHKKCEKQMANLCGVNQKLLAEALSSVKKAGSADGTSRTVASPAKSSSVSASESETTEDESETDTESDYKLFGLPEIRPPLQTRPKFKKYTIDDFLFVKVLGKGSYGKVMLAQQKDSENYFAVKCLKKDVVLEDNDVECTLIERKVLSLGTKHPYLCHLFCTFQTPSHLFFVMEYLTGGDLMFHIQHCGRFDEYRACFYGAEITSGLKFLHSKGIIYRDLKLDNILLDYQGHIRIADFGMCKLQVYLDRYADTFCGTPDYMAPEVIKGQHYNQCVDWWSFGVLLYEMLTGKSPFKGCDEDHLFWLICNDEPFFPKFLSLEATEILKGLLDKDSERRLGIPFSPYGEIKDHAFFKYVDWNKIDRKEVETPYKPRLRHILDVQYFDRLFTKRLAAITPLDESILATMDQTAFTDFTYTNPNITD